MGSAAAVQPGDKFYDDTDSRQQQTFAFLMESADKDGDGAISMDEFIEWGMNIGKQMEGDTVPDELMKFFKLNWRNTDQNDDGVVTETNTSPFTSSGMFPNNFLDQLMTVSPTTAKTIWISSCIWTFPNAFSPLTTSRTTAVTFTAAINRRIINCLTI